MARRKGRGATRGGPRASPSRAPSLSFFLARRLPWYFQSLNSGDAGGSSSGKRKEAGQVGDAGSGVACCPRSSSPQRWLQQRHSVRAEVRSSPTIARFGLLLRQRVFLARSSPADATATFTSDGSKRMWLLAVTTTFWGLLLAPGKRARGRAGLSRHLFPLLALRFPRGGRPPRQGYLAKFARSSPSYLEAPTTTTAALPQPLGCSLTRLVWFEPWAAAGGTRAPRILTVVATSAMAKKVFWFPPPSNGKRCLITAPAEKA